jgi:hypothetical protein
MDIDILIKKFREFISENPYEEIWRQLYYFTDVDSVNTKIRKRFKLEDGKHENDSKKQAQQLSYSIIQAKNYFESARYVDVSVKPNLIYYGMSSLANTVILYNNDGKFSLDYLRDTKKEEHHGLEKCFDLRKDGSLQDILKSISCKIYKKPDSGEPYGHFKNFYKSIVPECVFFDINFYISEKSGNLKGKKVTLNADKKRIKDLVDCKLDLLTMLKFLSDMVQQLPDNEIATNLCYGSMIFESRIGQNQSEEANSYIQNNYQVGFNINRLSPDKKEYFKKLYLQNKSIKLESEYLYNLCFLYDSSMKSEDKYFPDMVQDQFGAIYYIYDVKEYIQELANFYICFFCTGMLCRYYPDYWMHWIEKNVGFKHLMETLCSIAIRKFPNLILNQLTQCINYFHL